MTFSTERLGALRRFRRLTNFVAAAQIYLMDNVMLAEPLRPAHIKPRLLGHWGTSPGINLMHAGLNRLIVDTAAQVLLVTGVGHGAPANLANQWVDGTLVEVYPDFARDRAMDSSSWCEASRGRVVSRVT